MKKMLILAIFVLFLAIVITSIEARNSNLVRGNINQRNNVENENARIIRFSPTCRLLYMVFKEDFQNMNSGRGTISDVNDDGFVALSDLSLIQQNRRNSRWCRSQFFNNTV